MYKILTHRIGYGPDSICEFDSDGRRNGKYMQINKAGDLAVFCTYHDGDLHGDLIVFNGSGGVIKHQIYENGVRHGECIVNGDYHDIFVKGTCVYHNIGPIPETLKLFHTVKYGVAFCREIDYNSLKIECELIFWREMNGRRSPPHIS